MSAIDDIEGRPLALLLMCETDGAEPEWWVVHGTVAGKDGGVVFARARDGAEVPLEEEWLARVREVAPEHAEIFAPSTLYLPLSVGRLPEGADPEEFVFTGLRLDE